MSVSGGANNELRSDGVDSLIQQAGDVLGMTNKQISQLLAEQNYPRGEEWVRKRRKELRDLPSG